MNARVFSGDRRIDGVPASNRGLAYGDGLFETMRWENGSAAWWDRHWGRLRSGAERLRLTLPDEQRVRSEAAALMDGGNGVLKLIVTRGDGGRGYATDANANATWVLSRHALPSASPVGGLTVRWCGTRLSIQPALAGLKHCNRLEQVLARAEWNDGTEPTADEGLMRSIEGDAVCGTSSNLFVLGDGTWLTPPVDRCGVAGVCRGWVVETLRHMGLQLEERRLTPSDVQRADSVFLCNAVRGILPVARLDDRTWPANGQVVELHARLVQVFPALAPAA